MKHHLLNALLFALLISGACTYLLSRKVSARSIAPRTPDKRYAAPSQALQAGEALKPENMQLVSWPASNPLSGAFAGTAALAGRVVLYPLEKGQPILEQDLAPPGSAVGLAGKIPDGMRAIALRSDEVVGVAGFLIPGSHLDVLVSYRTDKLPEPITVTVLQNVTVLAAGQQIEPDPTGKAAAVTVVTLLLTPEESERAFLASNQGTIHFVLRNGADQSRSKVDPVYLSQLSAETAPIPAARKPSIKSTPFPARAMEIETILGDSKSGLGDSKSGDGKSPAKHDGGN